MPARTEDLAGINYMFCMPRSDVSTPPLTCS